MTSRKLRLDEWLVENGHYPSRARARDAILRGCVTLEGDLSPKPSRIVPADNPVQINDPAQQYVSRAALKLIDALEKTGYDPAGNVALDLGISTGGFTQVLLERGAAHVYGIEVGQGQLASALVNHPGLTHVEGKNARDLTLADLEHRRPEFLTCDVSFISLKLVLPPALEIAEKNSVGIFLVKPQFEVGKEALGKGGIVRDKTVLIQAAEDLKAWLAAQPLWRVTHFFPATITGGDGNQEYVLAGVKDG
ncbi:MAG: TlyA family RNA methyltransferase [Pseudomonadota bacterium]